MGWPEEMGRGFVAWTEGIAFRDVTRHHEVLIPSSPRPIVNTRVMLCAMQRAAATETASNISPGPSAHLAVLGRIQLMR